MDEITENQSSFQFYQYSQFRILQYPLFSDNGYMFPFFLLIKKSSDLIESPNSRRKELILESMEGTSKIVCKLWGNCALFDVPPQDSIITLTGMDVTSWRGEISLNSSVLTELKV